MSTSTVHEAFSSSELKDGELVVDTLLELLKEDDHESFREVLTAHIMTTNKVEFAKKSGIGRTTLYDLINPEKEFNPGLLTVSAIIKTIAS